MTICREIVLLLASIALHVSQADGRAINSTSRADACPGFAEGWIDAGDIGCYKLLATGAAADSSWFAAKLACEMESNGYLTELKTDAERNFIAGMTALYPSIDAWWIGLTDLEEEGTFDWFLSHEKADITNWASGSPDPTTPNNKDCVSLAIVSNAIQYSDNSCTAEIHGSGAICQFGEVTTTSPTTQPSTSAAHTECKSGWTIFGGVCYLVVSDRKLNWYNAESYCAEVADTTGGHLVSINSRDEETTVQNLFQSAYGGSTAFWMGGVRQGGSSGTWSDGSAWTYSNYGSTGTDGDCVYQGGDFSGGWKSASCTASAYFVCNY